MAAAAVPCGRLAASWCSLILPPSRISLLKPLISLQIQPPARPLWRLTGPLIPCWLPPLHMVISAGGGGFPHFGGRFSQQLQLIGGHKEAESGVATTLLRAIVCPAVCWHNSPSWSGSSVLPFLFSFSRCSPVATCGLPKCLATCGLPVCLATCGHHSSPTSSSSTAAKGS